MPAAEQTAKDEQQPSLDEVQQSIRVFSSGRRARKAGIAIKDCPFAKGSKCAADWRAGWRSVGTETDTGI